jgi:hypothetical protein
MGKLVNGELSLSMVSWGFGDLTNAGSDYSGTRWFTCLFREDEFLFAESEKIHAGRIQAWHFSHRLPGLIILNFSYNIISVVIKKNSLFFQLL